MKLTKLLRHFSHFLSSLFIIMATITTTIIATITTTTTSSSSSGIIFADAFCYTPLVTSSLSSSKRKTQHTPNINIQTPPLLLLQSMNYNNENMNHELQDQQQQDQEVENKKEKEKKEIPEDHYSKNHPMAGWAGWKHPQWGGYLDNIHKNVPENMSGVNEDE